MTDYHEFLASKSPTLAPAGFAVPDADLLPTMFDFQRPLTQWALRRGRAGIFADTGLGKTIMEVEWARQVVMRERAPVLIFAPLAVAEQTVREASAHGIYIRYVRDGSDVDRSCDAYGAGIYVTNYEMRGHFDLSAFAGVALDESSILKHHDSKTRGELIDACQSVPYRLSCTATPSPNDFMELANQAEFLGIMTRAEMLAMFFVHDGGETQKWRLKRHGRHDFWRWLASWAAVIRKPSDLGFSDENYDLPPLHVHEHVVRTDDLIGGELFPRAAMSLTEQRRAQRMSIDDRVAECAGLANASDDTWLIWCHLNDESDKLASAIDGAVQVRGSDSVESKRDALDAFSRGQTRVLVTKPSIAGFGMNWQHCHQMAFVGLSHSFEQFYQATRRCWRFGQKREVHAHLFTAESEGQVLESLKRKEHQHNKMADEMSDHMRELIREQIMDTPPLERPDYHRHVASGEGWELHLGDCVDVTGEIDADSIDYTIFSPPFASLYTYSASERDMGNVRDTDEFAAQFSYLVDELTRVTKPGRLLSMHVMNLPTSKVRDGVIGLRDFRGDLIRLFSAAGWIYHSEVCIWKDPVTAMQRTKALGLLHKQIRKDSAMSRQGIPDYVVTMRKPGENPDPVTHTNESFPVERWQRYASPVWMDIRANRTLAFRSARENDDERHICPLQLDVIERCIELWTNPGDLVLSPFAGIGSEGYVAIQANRQFIGAELKESYWQIARQHLEDARRDQGDMFA
jgi:superfamily II DNA or RNA helicase